MGTHTGPSGRGRARCAPTQPISLRLSQELWSNPPAVLNARACLQEGLQG